MKRGKRRKNVSRELSLSTESFQKRLSFESVALLEYRVDVLRVDGDGEGFLRISSFYEEIARRCISYVETVLYERVRQRYLASDDPHKRFRFRRLQYRHSVSSELVPSGELHVTRGVSLLHGGRALYEMSYRERWRVADGKLLRLKKREADLTPYTVDPKRGSFP